MFVFVFLSSAHFHYRKSCKKNNMSRRWTVCKYFPLFLLKVTIPATNELEEVFEAFIFQNLSSLYEEREMFFYLVFANANL